MGHETEWQKQLEAGLKRVQDALAKDARPHAQLLQVVVAAAGAKALEKINDTVEREEERAHRRAERKRRREEDRRRRQERDAKAAVPVGFVFAFFAMIALYFGVTRPDLWWMIFVSLGFAIPSAGIFGNAMVGKKERRTLPPEEAEATPSAEASAIDARLARVDAIVERILASLKTAPAAVREIVHKPEETLKALAGTCKELAQRERELRAALTEEDERRLRAERDGLSARVAAEPDAVVRQRLESALRALEAQLAQRAELVTAASRLEAEGTRILYTLENLHTQVLRARSADAASADLAGAGLRKSLEQLGEEIDAVASALEETHAPGLVSPVVDVGGDGGGTPGSRERERT